jgi:chloride channel 3/4/5
MWQSFVCAMSAAVILQAFDPFRSGKLVMYQTKYNHDWQGFEILPYAMLGIIGVSRFPSTSSICVIS